MSSIRRRLNPGKSAVLALIIVLLALTLSVASAANNQFQGQFQSVGESSASGTANLVQQSGGGTQINVVASGLKPGEQYVSLYYDNHVCQLEPYSPQDVVGMYTANASGVGTTQGKADDDLDEINSVSVRHAGDFKLLACVDVHPGQVSNMEASIEGADMASACATTTSETVAKPASIDFGPNDNDRTGFNLEPGSVFGVCTGASVQGWTVFKIDANGPVLFAREGTFR